MPVLVIFLLAYGFFCRYLIRVSKGIGKQEDKMEDRKTRIVFDTPQGNTPRVERQTPAKQTTPSMTRLAAPPQPPGVRYRTTPDGRPSNGNSNDFDDSFSLTHTSGIRYDFRDGLRLMVPTSLEGVYEVTAEDADTGFVFFRIPLTAGGSVTSRKKWRIPWLITVRKDGETVMSHVMSLKGQEVAIHYPKAGIGDTIAWFSYADDFRKETGCNLTICMEGKMRKLFEGAYPEFQWAGEDAWRTTPFYAVYHMGILNPDNENDRQPVDFRTGGLHHAAARILGLPMKENPPRVVSSDSVEIPDKPYVCIATGASANVKRWLNPHGWPSVVNWLKGKGYDVIDIDRDFVQDMSTIPYGTVDMTGDISLSERAALLKSAKAFVGVSSGMSWLAWACGTPVVLISGWTLPFTEFYTPYRVINEYVCHGCWNDTRECFDHYDTDYCPRHRDTPRQHECSKGISGEQVIRALARSLEEEL